MQNITKILRLITNLSFSFEFFKRKKILIYDSSTGKYYSSFFSSSQVFIFSNRIFEKNSKVSFFILIWTIFGLIKFKNTKLSQQYSINIFKIINPRIVITFTDYDLFIYKLKEIFPKKKFIIFQHQIRALRLLRKIKTHKLKNNYKIDHACIFGENYKKFYSNFLNTKFKVTGSIRNNYFKEINIKKITSLVLISRFRPHLKKYTSNFSTININKELIPLKIIKNFCMDKGLKLKILPWSSSENPQEEKIERNYYNRILGEQSFSLLNKKKFDDSYSITKKFNFFISFNSTLSYELLSRNARVAFILGANNKFNKNKKSKKNFSHNLTCFKPNGPFWTSNPRKKEIYRILNYLKYVNKKKLYSLKNMYIKPFMIHDKNFNKNKKFLKNIGLKI